MLHEQVMKSAFTELFIGVMIVIHAPNSDTENSSWPYNYEQPFSICAKYASVFDYFRQIIIRVEHAPTSVQRSKTRFINRDSESYRRVFGVGRVRFNASLGNADFFFFLFFFFHFSSGHQHCEFRNSDRQKQKQNMSNREDKRYNSTTQKYTFIIRPFFRDFRNYYFVTPSESSNSLHNVLSLSLSLCSWKFS